MKSCWSLENEQILPDVCEKDKDFSSNKYCKKNFENPLIFSSLKFGPVHIVSLCGGILKAGKINAKKKVTIQQRIRRKKRKN